MNIEEYRNSGEALYGDLCKTISRILGSIISSNPDYRLQHIAHRAKSPSSLLKRLEEKSNDQANNIEDLRKDLAGCRIVFYSNSDVSRFMNSGILRENFEINWERSKFHHPQQHEEDAASLFVSNNYVVKLKGDRISLAEYARFDGLWCEVQVQTTLNHVWAELSHDVIYKTPEFAKSAQRDMESIKRRLGDVMREHIVPAGYIFQKIESDAARIADGKNLFDVGLLKDIVDAPNNNERYSLIERFKDDVLPYYDDIESELSGIYAQLAIAWAKAESTPTVPHETPYGSYGGKTSDQVTKKIAEVLDRSKYLNIKKSYVIARNLFLASKEHSSKLQLCELMEGLAKYNIHILKRYGVIIQLDLLNLVSNETDDEVAILAPFLSRILGEVVKPDVTGTTNTSDTVTWHTGSITRSDEIEKARKASIQLLGSYIRMSVRDKEKRVILTILNNACRMPQMANYSDDVAVMIMSDTIDVIRLHSESAADASFEIKQYLEAELFRVFHRYQALSEKMGENAEIVTTQEDILTAITEARKVFDADKEFIIYKTLVGYESIFQSAWERGTYDYGADEEFRKTELQQYADVVDNSNWAQWKVRLERCASTESKNLATFPPLVDFVSRISKSRPELVFELLQNYPDSLKRLVPSMIFDLLSGRLRAEVIIMLNSWIDEGKNLVIIADSHRFLGEPDETLVECLVTKVLADENEKAAIALMEAAVRQYDKLPEFWKNKVFFTCLELLEVRKNQNWVYATWFVAIRESLFSQLDAKESEVLLSSLIPVESVGTEVEYILAAVASNHATTVFDWFGNRLRFAREDLDHRYETIPFSLEHLRTPLISDAAVVIKKIYDWLAEAPGNYEFHVCMFLSKLYPDFDAGLERELLQIIDNANIEGILFVLKILGGFEGKSFLNPICKAAISNSLGDEAVTKEVSSILQETGVVSGEYGFADAREEKKQQLSDWLTDEDENVQKFARSFFHQMDLGIASERRRAEEQIALRKLEYGEDIVGESEDPDPA